MIRRYILSILVKNHPGVLSRISGLFARRGYNITSLTVGETEDSECSRVTIELYGDEYVLEQIKNQLNKLFDVLQTLELSSDKAVLRELVLAKVRATDETRPAVVEIANIFRAKVVDIAENSLILEMTGSQDKINAFLAMVTKYGLVEVARTGITALGRGATTLRTDNK
jgi:acetolactate synthase-1/3 small subunit